MIPKKIFHSTTFSVQLTFIAGQSLEISSSYSTILWIRLHLLVEIMKLETVTDLLQLDKVFSIKPLQQLFQTYQEQNIRENFKFSLR